MGWLLIWLAGSMLVNFSAAFSGKHRSTLAAAIRFSSREAARKSLFPNESHDDIAREVESRLAILNGGEPINVNSSKQVSKAVFNEEGRKVDRSTLLEFAVKPSCPPEKRDLINLILKRRKLNNFPANDQLVQTITDTTSGEDTTRVEHVNEDTDPLCDLSEHERLIEELFSETKDRLLSDYWKDHLKRVTRPMAKNLIAQIHGGCPMGFDPLALGDNSNINKGSSEPRSKAASGAGKKGSLLDFCRERKLKHQNADLDHILLVRVGEFYETYGVDAIMLVEHCGLNSMGGKAKAGCPKGNIQHTLDCLTAKGFSCVVYEEGPDTDSSTGSGAAGGSASRIKNRFFSGIVTPANPSYLYNLVLLDENETFDSCLEPRPYVGILSSAAGFTLVEVADQEQTVRVSHRLTAEAVACRLSAYPPVDPLIYVPLPGKNEENLPFLPSKLETRYLGPGVKPRVKVISPTAVELERHGVSEDHRAKNVVVAAVLQLTESSSDEDNFSKKRRTPDDFIIVEKSNDSKDRKQTEPLYLETATQLGLMDDPSIPSLLSYILPESAPVATRRFYKKLLLSPPPPAVGNAIAKLVMFFKNDGPRVPQAINTIPPVGKVTAILIAGEASAILFRTLLDSLRATCEVVRILEASANGPDVTSALMTVLEYESGVAADPKSLIERCLSCETEIEDVLCNNDDNVSNYGGLIPFSFFQRNEDGWRGRVRRCHVAEAYKKVDEKAYLLAMVVAKDFWCRDFDEFRAADGNRFMSAEEIEDYRSQKPLGIEHDVKNNILSLKNLRKGVDKSKFLHPKDRYGKDISNRHTTERVRGALSDYVAACGEAKEQVAATLKNLSERLHDEGHFPAIVQASHANLIASSAYHHAVQAIKMRWSMCNIVETSSELPGPACQFEEMWPYWINHKHAEKNSFDVDGMWILTAPNMSGKSTIMRSAASICLLTVCGLCSPLKSGRVRRFNQIFVRGASSDVPIENKSAFGAEMKDVAAILKCCGRNSLVFVDELGRGTSPRDGTRIAAAVLEEMTIRGVSGIFATHLHDILDLPLNNGNRIVRKRMSLPNDEDFFPYTVEDGVCTDSMALFTAKRFGLPSRVLVRAEFFGEYLEQKALPQRNTFISPVECFSDTEKNMHGFKEFAEKIINCEHTLVPPGYMPPAKFCEKQSCVYILEIATDPPYYYVGESDNFQERIEKHRRNSRRGWKEATAIVFPMSNKSQARDCEENLIQKMKQAGFPVHNKIA